MIYARRLLRILASLQLAVLIIALLALLISVGTFVESRFDAWTAKNLVYASPWMYATMGLLATSLISVIIDRWPWKPRHIPFICAHVGILIILYGSLLTQLYGVDGTIRLSRADGVQNQVTTQETELTVFRSRTGEDYDQVYKEDVNFLKRPITEGQPYIIKAKGLDFEIQKFIPYARIQEKIDPSPNAQSGAALRFQLSNANVSQIDWLVQKNLFDRAEKQMGPVLISMGGLWERTPGINEIRFFKTTKGALNYMLFKKESTQPQRKGLLKEGDIIKTDWMNLELRALRYLDQATQSYAVTPIDHPTPMTVPALQVHYNGIESSLILNDYVKVFTDQWVYIIAYHNKKIPLGFDIQLTKFKKTDYPGSNKAMTYQSEVNYDGNKTALISMNEPLKHAGYYLYQASFEESPTGGATASILSVNRDPGRAWKYLGSLVMSIGILLMFYGKRKKKI